MKKYFSIMMLAAAGATFIACSDVPEPYSINLNAAQSTLVNGQVINESFASSLGTFQTKAVQGDYTWANQGHSCAQITSYVNGTNNAADAYLLSPKVTLEDAAYHFTFQYILRYGQAATLKQNHTVVISKDFSDDPATATWETLDFNPVEGTDWNTWQTADLAIPAAYQGQEVVVAFRYIGTTSKAATWEVKNVELSKGTVSGGGSTEPTGETGETKNLPYEESFATSMGAFASQTTSGSGEWVIDFSTAKATGYDGASKTTTAGTYFLVSPAISLNGVSAAHVAYEYILRYNKGDENQQVLISSDYAGDAAKATWTVLKKKHEEGKDWNTFSSSDITVPESFLGKEVRVAFLYNTNATSGSTWEVKNFSIKEGAGSEAADGSAYGQGGGETPTPAPSGEATGTGTLEAPFNAVAATNVATALGAGNTSTESYYIKGKISEIKYSFDAQHGTATFFITDDGVKADNQFQVYSTLYLGNRKWTTGDTQIKVGDEVIIYGQLTNYNGTPETASQKSYIYALNGQTEGGTPNPDPTPTPEPTPGVSLDSFTNGGFEEWDGSTPTGWQSTTTASTSGTLSQSTDAHSGNYSVCVAGTTTANKRLAYKELELEAGTYTVTFYAKAKADGGSVRPGYVPVKEDGTVGGYVYGDYVNGIPADSWTLVTYEFSLTEKKTVNLVVMNPKNPGADVLIDDYSIVKN